MKTLLTRALATLALVALAPTSFGQVRDDTTWIGGGTAVNVDLCYVDGHLQVQGVSASGMTNVTGATPAPGSTPSNPAAASSGTMKDPDYDPEDEAGGHEFQVQPDGNGNGRVFVKVGGTWVPMTKKIQPRGAACDWGGDHEDLVGSFGDEIDALPHRITWAEMLANRFTADEAPGSRAARREPEMATP